MKKSEYRQYIQSETWQQRRKAFLAKFDYCFRCELPRWLSGLVYDQDLHVHHRNYQHVGAELDEDLQPLCPRCHELETFGRSDLRKIPSHNCIVCYTTMFNPYRDICDICECGASEEEKEAARAGEHGDH